MTPRLRGSTRPLSEVHDVALLDLDGVVYVGAQPVAGASDALARVRQDGMRLAFVTNNASRPPQAVADRLTAMGVPATIADVTTSAQAAAHYLADRIAPGAPVLVVGGPGLREALTDRGLTPVDVAVEPGTQFPVAAVVQGFDAGVDWTVLAEAAVAIRAGARWVATNLDRTLPSERGPLPGNGSLVHTLVYALGVEPVSTGKPDPTMHRESVERSGATNPIVVGDRLDTDIEGAVAVGAASLLVLSGIAGPADVVAAPPGRRPDYLARDVSGLLLPHVGVDWSEVDLARGEDGDDADVDHGDHGHGHHGAGDHGAGDHGAGDRGVDAGGSARTAHLGVGRWRASIDARGVTLGLAERASATGGAGYASDDDELDALRTLAPAAWAAADNGRRPAIRAVGTDAAALLRRWELDH